MLKNKKMLSLIIAVLMVTTVLVGCGGQSTSADANQSPKDLVQDAFLNDVEITTQEFKIDMAINLTGTNVHDAEFDFISNLVNNSRMTLMGKIDTTAKKAEIVADLNVGGMAFEGKMFIDDNIIALNIPFLGMMMNDSRLTTGYIIIDSETLAEEAGQEIDIFGDDEEMVDLAKRIVEKYLDILDDSLFINNGEEEVTVGDSNVKTTDIEINITADDFKDIIINVIEMMEDPEFVDLLFELTGLSNGYNREEFQRDLDMAFSELDDNFEEGLDEIFEEMNEVIDFDNTYIRMNFYIDNNSNITKSMADMSFSFNDEDTSIQFGMNMESDAWNINQPLTIDLPEFNETNSIDFNELLFMHMGSFDL